MAVQGSKHAELGHILVPLNLTEEKVYPSRTAADIRTTFLSYCACCLFAVFWTDQSLTRKSEWRKVSRENVDVANDLCRGKHQRKLSMRAQNVSHVHRCEGDYPTTDAFFLRSCCHCCCLSSLTTTPFHSLQIVDSYQRGDEWSLRAFASMPSTAIF